MSRGGSGNRKPARRYTEDEFVADPERYGSAERFLHRAIETINDMAHHVVADEQLGLVDQYRDLPRRFAEADWIDATLEQTWIRMIGFRNVLVHEYSEVDHRMVYSVLQTHLGDLRDLRAVFLRFL